MSIGPPPRLHSAPPTAPAAAPPPIHPHYLRVEWFRHLTPQVGYGNDKCRGHSIGSLIIGWGYVGTG